MKCIVEFDKPKIIHDVGETTCRPFRDVQRTEEMKNMSAGAAPLKEYVAQIGRLDGDVFASGNRDNVSSHQMF